jgi:UDP-N-acetylmuramate: L-alanyl-gamma-D-glutamyl-meso-diaminopimelate ligase
MKNKIISKKAHIIGICGAGMSALTVLLKDAGYKVTGSDSGFFEPISGYLKKNKIRFNKKYSAKNIPTDAEFIVIGKNVHLLPEENPETKAALKTGIEIKSLPETLAMLSEKTENIVVVGSFGKSSVTTLVAWCLSQARKDPSYFIGAIPVDFKNSSHLGAGKDFVLEGDEYPSSNTDERSKFLHLNPASVLLISVEHDHVNIYPTEKSYIAPYKKLVAKIPKNGFLVYSKNGKNTEEVARASDAKKISYSLNDKTTTWYGENIKYGVITSFDLTRKSKKITTIKTSLLGNHNLENIIGAGALLLESKKIKPADFAKGVASFHGIKRRLELKNEKSPIPVYEDFGSSYKKARAGFDALRLHFPGRRIIAIFEPHAFSWRNKKFLPWYKNIFDGLSEVIMLPATTRGKLAPGQITTKDIWNEAKKYYPIHTARNEIEALKILKNIVTKKDIIILVSSGSMFGLTKSVPKLVKSLF